MNNRSSGTVRVQFLFVLYVTQHAHTHTHTNRYLQVHTVVPSDGGVLQKLGEIYDRLGDKQQAFQYYSDVMVSLTLGSLPFFTKFVV